MKVRSRSSHVLAALRGDLDSEEEAARPPAASTVVFGLRADLLAGLCFAIGIVVRLAEYLENRSLWLDEALLSLNVIEKPFPGLLGELDYQQGAPVGFLFLQKLAVALAGQSEYGLRLVPLLSSIAVLTFGYRLAVRLMGRSAGLIALGFLCLCDPLVYFAGEAKQYGLDACMTLLLLWSGLRAFQDRTGRASVLLAMLGAGSVWFSHPSLFILAGVGLLLLVQALLRRERQCAARLAVVAAAWAIGFALCYHLSLRHLAHNRFFQEFWAPAFVPPLADIPWFVRRTLGTFAAFLDLNPFPVVLCSWLAVGLAAGAVRRPAFFILGTTSITAAIVASSLRMYPLHERFLVFLIPIVVLYLAEGTLLWLWAGRRGGAGLGAIVLIGAFAYPAYRTQQEVRSARVVQDLKPVLQHMRDNAQSDDWIYVSHLAGYPFRYYAERYGFNGAVVVPGSYADPRLPERYAEGRQRLFRAPGRNPVLLGYVSYFTTEDFKDVISDLQPLLGHRRVWVLISHGTGGRSVGRSIVAYLDRVGRRLDSLRKPGKWGGSEVHLYDLSGPGAPAAEADFGSPDPDYQYRAAIEAQRAGDCERSLRHLERLERSGPLHGPALFAKAYALQLYGDTEEAVVVYRTLLAEDPRDMRARFFFGYALVSLERCAEATTVFERILALDPAADKAREEIARCRVRRR